MERRAASHTEEEEMNQRRKLLNAARRGDSKAISRLFELYQVRVLSGEQLAKVNRSSAYLVPVKPAGGKGGKAAAKMSGKQAKPAKHTSAKPVKSAAKVVAKPKAKRASARSGKSKPKGRRR
jgi:hypothetical protein